jgi:hypothetical protein
VKISLCGVYIANLHFTILIVIGSVIIHTVQFANENPIPGSTRFGSKDTEVKQQPVYIEF